MKTYISGYTPFQVKKKQLPELKSVQAPNFIIVYGTSAESILKLSQSNPNVYLLL